VPKNDYGEYMIIFLYGQDTYKISQKLKELVVGYKTKNPSGFNLVNLDFSEHSLQDFFEAVKSDSLIPEKKLIILKNAFSADSKEFLEFLKARDFGKREDVILIAISLKNPDKSELFGYLTKKPNQSQKFDSLKGYEIKNWAIKFAESLKIDFTGEALDFLVLNSGNDLWRLDSEIRKIADYKIKGVVSKSQVEDLMISNRERNIFELTDALAKKNKPRALTALHEALDGGEKPTELLGLLAWQARNILKFKSTENPSE
jgi:DNA polymerase III subunit delta